MNMDKSKKELMEELSAEINSCKKCGLWQTRTNPVIGEGSVDAKVMFVGEAPGYNEDRTGKPFCGASGKILDQLLDSAELKREDVFITSILKCRPPENRNPKAEEIASCSEYLDRQIDMIKPKIICCLGNFATAHIFKKFNLSDKIQGISKIHGQVFSINTLFGPVKIIPLYHPAVATYNINMLDALKKDFAALR